MNVVHAHITQMRTDRQSTSLISLVKGVGYAHDIKQKIPYFLCLSPNTEYPFLRMVLLFHNHVHVHIFLTVDYAGLLGHNDLHS